MVYIARAMLAANQMFGPLTDYDPGMIAERAGNAETLGEAVQQLGLYDHVPADVHPVMQEFFAHIPEAVDAAIMGAARSAVARGMRVSFVWQEAASYEVRIWEVSREDVGPEGGLVTIFIRSIEPERPTSA